MDVQPARNLAPLSAEELADVRARVLVQRPLHWSITLRLVLEVLRSREEAARDGDASEPARDGDASELEVLRSREEAAARDGDAGEPARAVDASEPAARDGDASEPAARDGDASEPAAAPRSVAVTPPGDPPQVGGRIERRFLSEGAAPGP